ncbi:MAG: hypothetical protein KC619_14720, partial [Myxococcales bacterium]|nr:hypothetical protein [Myxococcales bacterium]
PRSAVLFGLVLVVTSPAAAQTVRTVRVEAPGCPALEPMLAAALRLEASEAWHVVDTDAELVVGVAIAGCDDDAWTLTIAEADGAVVRGPEPIAMGAFGESTRVRVAALWAAEHLQPDSPRAVTVALDDPSSEPLEEGASGAIEVTVIDEPATEGDAAPEVPEPPASGFRPRPVLEIGAGVAYVVDPAQLADVMVRARAGLSAQLLEWLLVGGFLEGGALFEPFAHTQPFFRFCIEPRAELDVGPIRVGILPKLCTSLSRHLRTSQDFWAGGLAVGAALRMSLALAGGFGIGLRLDADAWERDLIVGTPDASLGGSAAADLPWIGVFGAWLELEVR